MTNYTGNITPYSINTTLDQLVYALDVDTNILTTWFQIDYLKRSTDECHLLLWNDKECIFVNAADHVIECENSVQRLDDTIDA